jgi:hypothetical protein
MVQAQMFDCGDVVAALANTHMTVISPRKCTAAACALPAAWRAAPRLPVAARAPPSGRRSPLQRSHRTAFVLPIPVEHQSVRVGGQLLQLVQVLDLPSCSM